MTRIKIHNFKFVELDRIYNLSKMLAQFFPDQESCALGIYELMLNAIEHGNLGIGYEEKTALILAGKWYDEVMRRLTSPLYADTCLDITLWIDEDKCQLTIGDRGKGFDWRTYVGRIPDDHLPNGRGLSLAMNSKFDDIIFNPTGNEVTCIAQYKSSTMSSAA